MKPKLLDSRDGESASLADDDSLRTDDYRLVTHDRGTRLYRLPEESTDVGESFPEIRDRLCGLLTDWRAEYGQPIVETVSEDGYDERTKQRLADLGYLR